MRAEHIEDIYPLSPMQQGILFHALNSPGVGTYVEQIHWTWHGALDVGALQRAWERVVERHSVLRTAFMNGSGPQR